MTATLAQSPPATCSPRIFAIVAECVPDVEWFLESFEPGEILRSAVKIQEETGYCAVLIEVATLDHQAILELCRDVPGGEMMVKNNREIAGLFESLEND